MRHGHPRRLPREEIARVGRKIVAVLGESVSVSVSVSASWNASFTKLKTSISGRHSRLPVTLYTKLDSECDQQGTIVDRC